MTKHRMMKLQNEHIIDSGYTLPPNWRVLCGLEWMAQLQCYIAFHLYDDLETDAYLKIEDCINATWELERGRNA